MSNQEIDSRELSRVWESLETIASQEVLHLCRELEILTEIRCIHEEKERLQDNYRHATRGE